MDFIDVSIFATSALGVFSGIWGYLVYKPTFDLHGYLGGKAIGASALIAIITTVMIAAEYGVLRGALHLALYFLFIISGVTLYKLLKQR